MQNQKQYEEQESARVCAPADSEQKDGNKNDSLVYNIDSNIYKTIGAEESIAAIAEVIKADIEAFVELIKGLIKPRNCDYIFTYANDSSKCGINPNYWTSFVRVLKRSGF
ncbi:hypothetical protein MSMAL_1722 [Methanosarcina mazei LYC]|uniref:Uncharacterized protein n=2 Tax=Methanosarcina mazei TaxID=2209 RepID=A0A0E3WNY3_METMZ|nr:hypothetical protein MSMAL_1722 [Methanosarcina mazei LYC]